MSVEANRFINLGGGKHPLTHLHFVAAQDLPNGPTVDTEVTSDVVHSMDIAAAVGPERLREIMSELVSRCAIVVKRYGGTVDKFTGDGIMAVFGAPIALGARLFCLGRSAASSGR